MKLNLSHGTSEHNKTLILWSHFKTATF